ncbi:hypothetical protein AB0M23_21750 [Streptomyces sp. NPDC052077]|uniref:hypothetical protein n=1 Tax=Streptomyces sp. NPDC052077 TaxID=3154757 RepID=UPI003422AD29
MAQIRSAIGVTLALLVVTLAACSASDAGGDSKKEGRKSPTSPEVSVTDTEPPIIVHSLSVLPGMTIGGTLVSSDDGKCLTVRGVRAEEDFVATPIWPKGTKVVRSDAAIGVSVPGYGRLAVGDRFKAAGSYWESSDERARGIEISSDCLAEDGFIVINPDSIERG